MLESAVEKHLVRRAEALGGIALKMAVPGWVGWPDRLVILPGNRIGLAELKRPSGGRLSENQKENIATLEALGVNVVRLNTKEQVDVWIEQLAS